MIRSTSVLRYAAIGMATLALGGFAAASSASISGITGPQSHNSASATLKASNKVSNNNFVGLSNLNSQGAGSGNVSASDNTTAGDAMSGTAGNSNTTDTGVAVNNAAAGSDPSEGVDLGGGTATLDATTGPQSQNDVSTNDSFSNEVNNDNVVSVLNANEQEAVSGNASAKDNTTAGDVTSGDASNMNDTTSSVTISN